MKSGKFIVAVDCEGVACAVGKPGGGVGDSGSYEFIRKQATREADAAARALFDCGASSVVVWDNHSSGVNLIYDELDSRCDIALGCLFPNRWPALDASFDGVLLVGYHSMENTMGGVLAHSYSSTHYQWLKINGVEMGEMEIDGALAGEAGVPVIFAASDEKGAAEARRFFPWAETVWTKRGLSWSGAISKHPLRACGDIYERVKRAAARLSEMKPFLVSSPVEYEVRFKRIDQADAECSAMSGRRVERLDAFTIRARLEQLGDLF